MARKLDLKPKLARLRQFWLEEQRVPTYAEMMALFGYRTKSAVAFLLRRLRDLGYVRPAGPGRWRLTDRLTGRLRLLGAVQAGFPSPAEEELVDTLSLDEYLIQRPETTFMLTVQGDSMSGAGILPGDLVLVEKGTAPRNRDIVIAQVDDEWTLKYYVLDAAGVRLDPANPKYRFIRPRRSLVIGGVVRGVVRRYA